MRMVLSETVEGYSISKLLEDQSRLRRRIDLKEEGADVKTFNEAGDTV